MEKNMEPSISPSAEEEIVALKSIYTEDEFKSVSETNNRFEAIVNLPNNRVLKLRINLPKDYPSKTMPSIECTGKWLHQDQAAKLIKELKNLYDTRESEDEIIIFKWIEWLRENTESFLKLPSNTDASNNNNNNDNEGSDSDNDQILLRTNEEAFFKYWKSEAVTDRKSKFIAHLAEVHSLEDVKLAVEELKLSSKKIAEATHNTFAYRIERSDGSVDEGRDDDGEGGAGDKMLYVLQNLKAINCVVIVTRWFGGIELGPDRFKHISNQTKEVLLIYLNELELRSKESGPKEKKKLRPAEDVMSRILHDSSLNADEFIIGYEDRFEGLQELVIKEFIEVEIPMHRIRYFKRGNEVVWDRKKRLDKIFQ
jgi:uncharacterized protein (UPF0248 family)